MTSTSSRMMIDYIAEVSVASSLLYGHVRAMSKFLVACFDIFKVLLAFPCIFKVLIGTSCNFNVLLAFLKSQCLAIVLCTLDVWAMLPLKNWCNFDASASANVECCRGFMTKMNIGTALVQMKFWCGFINIGTDLMRMKCWRSFMAKMDVGTTLVWMKCWRGFMIKMNFGTALVWMKCCHGFTTKTTVGTTSVQMMVWLQYECKC